MSAALHSVRVFFPINDHVTVESERRWLVVGNEMRGEKAEDKKSFCVTGIHHEREGGNSYEGGVVSPRWPVDGIDVVGGFVVPNVC